MPKTDASCRGAAINVHDGDNVNPNNAVKVLASEMNSIVVFHEMQNEDGTIFCNPCDHVSQRSVEEWSQAIFHKLNATQLNVSTIGNSTMSKFADIDTRLCWMEGKVCDMA